MEREIYVDYRALWHAGNGERGRAFGKRVLGPDNQSVLFGPEKPYREMAAGLSRHRKIQKPPQQTLAENRPPSRERARYGPLDKTRRQTVVARGPRQEHPEF